MNFIDPKELDIPNHGTKNRYKTILPSEYSQCCYGVRNTSKTIPVSDFLLNQEVVLLCRRDLVSKANNRKDSYYRTSLFPMSRQNNTFSSEHSLFSHCRPGTYPD